jgi:diguanylate cyclase (GGDEF)-like protein
LTLLVAEALVYFGVMATLFRLRGRFGIGVFFTALGTMHFLETYLAAILYVAVPPGIVFSPGSTVLFAGKLVILLLLYVREDAAAVRQPIYGLLFGNFLTVGLVLLLRRHPEFEPLAHRLPDFAFMDQMGGLMVWGTLLLFVDSIGMILLYERSARWFGDRIGLRIWFSAAVTLTFDQLGFYGALYLAVGAPPSVLYGGWAGKMGATVIYAVLATLYLRYFEHRPTADRRLLTDIFDALTYRQRYEALLEKTGRDPLTGLLDRGRLEDDGPLWFADADRLTENASMLVIDVDHFKSINDRFGHAAGDEALRLIGQRLAELVRGEDRVYRYGGEEFVVLCDHLSHGPAMMTAERLRLAVAATTAGSGHPLTVSIGVATAPVDAKDFRALFAAADARLYAAKEAGRDRVVGRTTSQVPGPAAAVVRPA